MSSCISKKGNYQAGWRIPVDIIAAVKTAAKAEGIRPGQFLERAIRRHFAGPQLLLVYESRFRRLRQQFRERPRR